MAHSELLQAICSPLLGLDEIDHLAESTITFRANQNGNAHSPSCHTVRSKATATQIMTVAQFREAADYFAGCRFCGGGILTPAVDELSEPAHGLIEAWRSRAAAERAREAERRRAAAEEESARRRADEIDKRARDIIFGWKWDIERELPKASGYPEATSAVAVTCSKCDAPATITFEPRALRVRFTCSQDATHGYVQDEGDDDPFPLWARHGLDYVAMGLVAPILAGADGAWERIYGSRADDYWATVNALADFDAAYPEPMRLVPDIRCGECSSRMRVAPAWQVSGKHMPARYMCAARRADGHPRREKDDVDRVIDARLLESLRDHPSWATAPELEPAPEAVVGYADYLTAKIAIYDSHIGAACNDAGLRQQRAELHDTLELVTTIQEQGALATARLTYFYPLPWYGHDRSPFSDLARALLTTGVKVTEPGVTVRTRIDEGTDLRRVLRLRELRAELAEVEHRHREIVSELASLGEDTAIGG